MKVLLDIDEEYYNQAVMLDTKVGAFLRKGRPINDHVTVTNGDVFKALFPKAWRSNYIDIANQSTLYVDDEHELKIDADWWNIPYEVK